MHANTCGEANPIALVTVQILMMGSVYKYRGRNILHHLSEELCFTLLCQELYFKSPDLVISGYDTCKQMFEPNLRLLRWVYTVPALNELWNGNLINLDQFQLFKSRLIYHPIFPNLKTPSKTHIRATLMHTKIIQHSSPDSSDVFPWSENSSKQHSFSPLIIHNTHHNLYSPHSPSFNIIFFLTIPK